MIKTVSSSLDLDRVLRGIVDIATDATGCHACFIYFLEGDRLVLRAASPQYAACSASSRWAPTRGSRAGSPATRRPSSSRENAMDDQRMKYVPELEEERFQSMVAVPILAKSGEVIGVAVLHTAAPREFEEEVLNFLVHTASLVAGAIENAQLYEETRRRVQALTTLTELSQAVAAVTTREALYEAVTRGARELLDADACQIYRLDAESRRAGAGRLGSRQTPPPPSSRPGGTRPGARPDAPRQRPRPGGAAHGGADPVARHGRGRAAGGAPGDRRRAPRDPLLPRQRAGFQRRGRRAAAAPSQTRPRSG